MKNDTDPFLTLKVMAQPIYEADTSRTYHNWQHITETLRALDMCMGDYLPSKLALMYHDIVYIPGSKYNEEMSAQHLRYHCLVSGVADDLGMSVIDEAVRLIENTIVSKHLSKTWKPESEAAAWVMDCDLVALINPSFERFVHTQDLILAEIKGKWLLNPAMTDMERSWLMSLRSQSAAFLQGFLDKPRIYHSEQFKKAGFELDARKNIDAYQRKYLKDY